ncbi:MAG: transposase domain-containing protein [Undibacterium sp.]|nr:transposase domain-containing protein [Undibacterium sp.]
MIARSKAVLGAGVRLSDHLSARQLARTYPTLIAAILDEHQRNSQRLRSLPAMTVVYFCVALRLYPEAAYEHVYSVVAQGLSWMQGGNEEFPLSSSIGSDLHLCIFAYLSKDGE